MAKTRQPLCLRNISNWAKATPAQVKTFRDLNESGQLHMAPVSASSVSILKQTARADYGGEVIPSSDRYYLLPAGYIVAVCAVNTPEGVKRVWYVDGDKAVVEGEAKKSNLPTILGAVAIATGIIGIAIYGAKRS